MHQLAEYTRTKALVLATALTLACGMAALPQQALAEDDTEQPLSAAIVNDDSDADKATDVEANAPEQIDLGTPVVDEGGEVTEPSTPAPVDDNTSSDDTVTNTDETNAVPGESTEAVQPTEEVKSDVSSNEAKTEKDAEPVLEQKKRESGSKAVSMNAQQNNPIVKDGTYIIETGLANTDGNGLAEKVLDIRGGTLREGVQVISWSYYSEDARKNWSGTTDKNKQYWVVTREGDSEWYTIAAKSNTDLVMTAVGGQIYLTQRTPDLASQLWKFLFYGTSYGTSFQLQPKGTQKAVNDQTITGTDTSKKALDVRRSSGSNGADMILYDRASAIQGNQEFFLVDPKPQVSGGNTGLQGRYRVKGSGSNNAIEIRRGSKDNGANVWLWENNNAAHQDVYLMDEGNGFYSLWIMGTNKVIDVAHSSILVGARVIQWAYTGNDNQKWSVSKTSNGDYIFINKKTGIVLGAVTTASTAGCGNNICGKQEYDASQFSAHGKTNRFSLSRIALFASEVICKIQNTSTKKVLDVGKSSTANNASISFYTDGGTKNQRFQIVQTGTIDKIRIRTASSGGWVIVNNGNTAQYGKHADAVSNSNSWIIIWKSGNYQLKNVATSKVLSPVSIIAAPITIQEGLYEIHSNASCSGFTTAGLDNPGNSHNSGTRVNVYPENNAVGQKWVISKSGDGYRITALDANLALATSGSNIALYRQGNGKDQIWTIGIADGGNIKFINGKDGRVLDITGSGSLAKKSTATQLYKDDASREAHQSWKLEVTSGWFQTSGHWRYYSTNKNARFDNDINTSGKNLGHYDVLHDIWDKIKTLTSQTKYIVAASWDSCYVGIFERVGSSWEPLLGFNCGNGSKNVIESKARENNPGTTWTWDPYWNRLLAASNVKSKMPDLPPENDWARKLDNTWNGSRVRKVNANEQWFTSVSWTLGFHTFLSSTSELGKHLSNGCMRLEYRNAQWIYENIGPGTRCLQLRTKAYA